ncbi:MAG: YgiT-type zinc finger protein [Defluviitaleaceae bacterium]|nr:YgiT-type zinc finger protein [Defluviitaleaceae bacterium]
MCVFCKGKLIQSQTDYIEKNKNLIALVRDVPCEKCGQCGETYFENNTVLELEQVLNKIQDTSSEITLTVMDYKKIAA